MVDYEDPDVYKIEEDKILHSEDLALTFWPTEHILPQTQRTADLLAAKEERRRKKREEVDALRKAKEQEEAQRRIREQEQKKLKAQQEQKKKEAERRLREEEEQRKKMQGGLEKILQTLHENTSESFISMTGIELSSVRLRLLAKALEKNHSCESLDLSRKGLNDDDGVSLAQMLQKNKHLQTLTLEGNNLGLKTAKELAVAIGHPDSQLKSLNLEANNITFSGNDQTGVIDIAKALEKNRSLLCLNMVRNHITPQGGEALVSALKHNNALTMCDLTGNECHVDQLRKIFEVVDRNRAALSVLRRNQRRERFTLYAEEFRCRQYDMQVEATRLEQEAMEERRLTRLRERLKTWRKQKAVRAEKEDEIMKALMDEYEDRKAAKGGKKKKGKGKKK